MPYIPVTGREMMRALERLGWRVSRISGSHSVFRHPDKPSVSFPVPIHGNKTLNPGVFNSILRLTGVTIEELRDAL